MPKKRVFVDTNIIIEAFRTNSWTAICQQYAVETVERCIEEALTGDPFDPNRVPVDREMLINGLSGRHPVGRKEVADFVLSHPGCPALDDGEQHLLAWLYAQKVLPDALILLSLADKAAIRAAHHVGWLDSVTSLEHIVQTSGVTRIQVDNLKGHYRADWLDGIKLKIRLGVIP
jgi:hypothetical protein